MILYSIEEKKVAKAKKVYGQKLGYRTDPLTSWESSQFGKQNNENVLCLGIKISLVKDISLSCPPN